MSGQADQVELIGPVTGFNLQLHQSTNAASHCAQVTGVFVEQAVDDVLGGMHDIAGDTVSIDGGLAVEGAEQVVADALCRLGIAAAYAGGTVAADLAEQAVADSVPADLNQSEFRKTGDIEADRVISSAPDEGGMDGISMVIASHADEVDDHDPADVTQPELVRYHSGGFQVGPQCGRFPGRRVELGTLFTSMVVIASVCSMTS